MLQPLRDFPLLRDAYNEGWAVGEAKARVDSLLDLLESKGLRLSDDQHAMVRSCTDLNRLTVWWQRSLRSSSLDEILS